MSGYVPGVDSRYRVTMNWINYEKKNRGMTTDQVADNTYRSFADLMEKHPEGADLVQKTIPSLVRMATNTHEDYLYLCELRSDFAVAWHKHYSKRDWQPLECLQQLMPCKEVLDRELDPIEDEEEYHEFYDEHLDLLEFIASGVSE